MPNMLHRTLRHFSSPAKVLRQAQFNAGGSPADSDYSSHYDQALKDFKYIKTLNNNLKAQNACVVFEKIYNMTRAKVTSPHRAICGHMLTNNSRNMFVYLFTSYINLPKNMSYVVNITEYWKNQEHIFRMSNFLNDEVFENNLYSTYSCAGAQRLLADYFGRRDKVKIDPDTLILVNGHIKGLEMVLDLAIESESDGVMLAKPFLAQWNDLINYKKIPHTFYSLEYDEDWNIDIAEVARRYDESKARGVTPKVFMLSNPNDLTGSTMPRKSVEAILQFCYERNMLLYVNEENGHIASDNSDFKSIRIILEEMPEHIKTNLQVVIADSINSVYIVDIGFRAAHIELINFDSECRQMIREISHLNPPPVVDLITVLVLTIMNSVEMSTEIINEDFADSSDHYCNQLIIETRLKQLSITKIAKSIMEEPVPEFTAGCHYLMRFKFPQKFIDFAKSQGKAPDVLFCEILFDEEKILAVAGSAFGCKTPDFIRMLRLNLIDAAFMDVVDRAVMAYGRVKEDYD
jgi:aspartate/methionine/tyrosine aminotransferase